jgi:hypothetical protein
MNDSQLALPTRRRTIFDGNCSPVSTYTPSLAQNVPYLKQEVGWEEHDESDGIPIPDF